MAGFKDETGNRYGKLVVVMRVPRTKERGPKWLCKCDCGKEKSVSTGHLRSGFVKSCGCAWAIDETGNVYGKLTVVKVHEQKRHHSLVWICDCACGKKDVLATGSQLRKGLKNSCGCLVGEAKRALARKRFPWGGPLQNLMQRYISGADKRGIAYGLSVERFASLVKGNCHYCGAEPSRSEEGGRELFNGIDRVDNDKGYLPDNCVTCCYGCNSAKLDLGEIAFARWAVSVSKHWAENRLAVL